MRTYSYGVNPGSGFVLATLSWFLDGFSLAPKLHELICDSGLSLVWRKPSTVALPSLLLFLYNRAPLLMPTEMNPAQGEVYSVAVVIAEPSAFPEMRRGLLPAFRATLAGTEDAI